MGPGVAEPQGRQHVDRIGLGPPVADRDPHEHVVGVRLRVVDLDDPVAVVVEDARVDELVLGLLARPAGVLGDQVVIRERRLRVVVAPAEPGARRQRVEVPPVLLGVLAVVALAVRQAEDPLLEDRVAPVPQRERQAHPTEHVGIASEALLVPAVRPRARMVVRERRPGIAVSAVVLAHRAPGSFGEVGTPAIPGPALRQALLGVTYGLHAAELGVRGHAA